MLQQFKTYKKHIPIIIDPEKVIQKLIEFGDNYYNHKDNEHTKKHKEREIKSLFVEIARRLTESDFCTFAELRTDKPTVDFQKYENVKK